MSFQYLACETLSVGPYTLPAADGSSGQTLTTDGSGGCYWFGLSSARSTIDYQSEIEKLNKRIEELEKIVNTDMVIVPNAAKSVRK